jgi:dihydroneopterin aldolase
MKFYAFHGVGAQERLTGNRFLVSLTLEAPLSKAVYSDDIGDTVCYAEVFSIVKGEMDIPSRLIEHVAGRILKSLKERFPQITAMELSVSKLNPPVTGDMPSAAVVIRESYEDGACDGC